MTYSVFGGTLNLTQSINDLSIISYLVMSHVQDDYRRTITELDEKEFISLRLVIIEMRNHYVSYASVND